MGETVFLSQTTIYSYFKKQEHEKQKNNLPFYR